MNKYLQPVIISITTAIIIAIIMQASNMYLNSKLQPELQKAEIEKIRIELNQLNKSVENLSGSNGVIFGKVSNIEGKIEILLKELDK